MELFNVELFNKELFNMELFNVELFNVELFDIFVNLYNEMVLNRCWDMSKQCF